MGDGLPSDHDRVSRNMRSNRWGSRGGLQQKEHQKSSESDDEDPPDQSYDQPTDHQGQNDQSYHNQQRSHN